MAFATACKSTKNNVKHKKALDNPMFVLWNEDTVNTNIAFKNITAAMPASLFSHWFMQQAYQKVCGLRRQQCSIAAA